MMAATRINLLYSRGLSRLHLYPPAAAHISMRQGLERPESMYHVPVASILRQPTADKTTLEVTHTYAWFFVRHMVVIEAYG